MAIHDDVAHGEVLVPQQGFAACVDQWFQVFIDIRVHVGGNFLVQHEIDASIALQFKAEQEDGGVITRDILQLSPHAWCYPESMGESRRAATALLRVHPARTRDGCAALHIALACAPLARRP
jgi:hypothetical protein